MHSRRLLEQLVGALFASANNSAQFDGGGSGVASGARERHPRTYSGRARGSRFIIFLPRAFECWRFPRADLFGT